MASSSGTKRKREVIDLEAGDVLSTKEIESTILKPMVINEAGLDASRHSVSPPRSKKTKTASNSSSPAPETTFRPARRLGSPIKLTSVEGLPASVNVDTVSLEDILGNPLIKQCWAFNYLTDVDFLLSKFDADIRDQVQLTVVHGFWKKEEGTSIKEAAARHQNVTDIAAYLPEPFGTHHSKMLILTRHDDLAQVVILTANFIEQDWRMTQAAWISPLLPLLQIPDDLKATDRIGSGSKFKFDLLSYLKTYERKLTHLVTELQKYDFSEIKAALIASVPRKIDPQNERANGNKTNWGWPGLRHILRSIPCHSSIPEIVVQVSSVATLGVKDTWLRQSFFSALRQHTNGVSSMANFHIIFPVAEEIRRCISGYEAGSSIHMKTQHDNNKKQLSYIRPLLRQWAGDTGEDAKESSEVRRAGRRRAGPHIKTYVRFTDSSMTKIEWAMVTSANLSTQAWGITPSKESVARISSYEIGVVVWPDLFKEDHEEQMEMVPVFMKDQPDQTASTSSKVGIRMPYDLPLVPYGKGDEPWCATKPDSKEDWLGRAWPGYG